MFWKKRQMAVAPVEGGPTAATVAEVSPPVTTSNMKKLPGPKEVPELIGRHLVVSLKKNPDWVWRLKGVLRERPEGKDTFDFRIFEQAQVSAKKVNVKNYTSLDGYSDLILYEGWFDKKTSTVYLDEKTTS